jgi:uncharacterized membrane protein
MKIRRLPSLLVLLPLALAACGDRDGPEADPPEAAAEPDPLTPGVVLGPMPAAPREVQTVRLWVGDAGEIVLAPCVEGTTSRSPDAVALEDATGRDLASMVAEFGNPDRGVIALVVIRDDRIASLRIAPPEVAACGDLMSEGEVVASGNEPFWHVRITGEEAVWTTPEELEGVEFHDGSWSNEGDHWRFEALRDFVDGIEYLVLEVRNEPCSDSMAGTRYPWTAAVERGGERWTGCAREGADAG